MRNFYVVISLLSVSVFCGGVFWLQCATEVIQQDDRISEEIVGKVGEVKKEMIPFLASHNAYTTKERLVENYIKARERMDIFGHYLIEVIDDSVLAGKLRAALGEKVIAPAAVATEIVEIKPISEVPAVEQGAETTKETVKKMANKADKKIVKKAIDVTTGVTPDNEPPALIPPAF